MNISIKCRRPHVEALLAAEIPSQVSPELTTNGRAQSLDCANASLWLLVRLLCLFYPATR